MIKLNGYVITPTIFPDKTSQVWKLDRNIYSGSSVNKIEFDFESEAEIFHLIQLKFLLEKLAPNDSIELRMQYLPYGRQDKDISNTTTFALGPFLHLMSRYFLKASVLDAHNPKALPSTWKNILPNDRIKEVIATVKPNFICFPDKGASSRGYDIGDIPFFVMDKTRDQSTGQITGIYSPLPLFFNDTHRVLIIDDICDGGRTFIEVAKVLKDMGYPDLYLYTTHGLYTKGTQEFKDNGFLKLFTFAGEKEL